MEGIRTSEFSMVIGGAAFTAIFLVMGVSVGQGLALLGVNLAVAGFNISRGLKKRGSGQ